MKKILIRFFIVLFIFFAILYWIAYSIFAPDEPSPPIYIPENIISLNDFTNKTEIEKVVNILQLATPTYNESVQDTPSVENYKAIVIKYTQSNETYSYDTTTFIFIYESSSWFGLVKTWYLEQPYHGIYEIDEDSANRLLELLNFSF
jgi:hypothetical protein